MKAKRCHAFFCVRITIEPSARIIINCKIKINNYEEKIFIINNIAFNGQCYDQRTRILDRRLL